MRVLVCGGRDFNDDERVYDELNRLDAHGDVTAIIHGAAKGADSAAGRWARPQQHIEEIRFPADWKKHGKAAGPIRNNRMIAEGKPDMVLAFPGCRGTQNMVAAAKANGVVVVEITPPHRVAGSAASQNLPRGNDNEQ